MSNTTRNLNIKRVGPEGHHVDLPVDGGSHIFRGSLVAALTATGMLVPGTTASSGHACGIATHEQDATGVADNVKSLRVETDRDVILANDTDDPFTDADIPGAIAWMVDDHTLSNDSDGGTRKAGGIFQGMDPSGVRITVTKEIETIVAARDVADGPVFVLTLTVGHADSTDADTSQQFNIGGVPPAGAILVGREVTRTTAFAGGTVSDLKLEIGTVADPDAIMTALDVDTGTGTALAGTSGVNPTGSYGGTQLVATFTSTGDNLVNLTAGACTIKLTYFISP